MCRFLTDWQIVWRRLWWLRESLPDGDAITCRTADIEPAPRRARATRRHWLTWPAGVAAGLLVTSAIVMLALWLAPWTDDLTAAQVAEASREWIGQLDQETWRTTGLPDAGISARSFRAIDRRGLATLHYAAGPAGRGVPRRSAAGSCDRLAVRDPDTARTATACDSTHRSRFDHPQSLHRCLEEQRLPVCVGGSRQLAATTIARSARMRWRERKASGFRLQASGFRLQASGFRFRRTSIRLRSTAQWCCGSEHPGNPVHLVSLVRLGRRGAQDHRDNHRTPKPEAWSLKPEA